MIAFFTKNVKVISLATYPPTRHAQGRFDLVRFFYWPMHCPKPEVFLIPHQHVMNNNTQRRIPHQTAVILPLKNPRISLLDIKAFRFNILFYINQVVWPVILLTLFKIIAQDLHTKGFSWRLYFSSSSPSSKFTFFACLPQSHFDPISWSRNVTDA